MRFTNEKYEYDRLDWDTGYFGVNSARVILKEQISMLDLQAINKGLHGYEFITITNMNNNSSNNYLLGRYFNAFLVDVNMQFEKYAALQAKVDTTVSIEANFRPHEKVREIAAKSFSHSRFFNDPFLDRVKAKKLYETWVSNSFNSDEKFFVCAKSADNVAGFILFSFLPNTDQAVIELIAVSDEYVGQGIGKRMVSSLEHYVSQKGCKYLKVGTQVDNLSAQRFYCSCGFKLKQCNSVYHLWNLKEAT